MINRNHIDFAGDMDHAKTLAMVRRNRGQHVGKCAKGWNYKRPDPTGLDRLEAEFYQWRKDWQYRAYLAVEWALFGHEWEGLGF